MTKEKDSKLPSEKPLELLQQLAPHISEIARATPNESTEYDQLLRAALAKCFEFSLYIFEDEDSKHSFFSLPTLRGICEDLISLKYFAEKVDAVDREEILLAFAALNIFDGLKRQTTYFEKNRPLQPILKDKKLYPDIERYNEMEKQKIKSFKNKYHWRRNYPTVEEMAKAAGLEELYNYLYAASSRAVHFTPHVLGRMGWTIESLPKDEKSENIGNYEMQFSTQNFSRYYQEFCEFYSLQLLILFLETFSKYLEFNEELRELQSKIKMSLKRYIRWPELITFEEMNFKSPSSFMYTTLNMYHNIQFGDD